MTTALSSYPLSPSCALKLQVHSTWVWGGVAQGGASCPLTVGALCGLWGDREKGTGGMRTTLIIKADYCPVTRAECVIAGAEHVHSCPPREGERE